MRIPDRPFRPVQRLGRTALLALALGAFGGLAPVGPGLAPALAQGLFAPVIQVNDRVITQYEVNQRALFYVVLNAPGNPQEGALERLIEERLQVQAAEALGIVVTPEELATGEAEFAARVNLSREQFLQALAGEGIEYGTFRDFVHAGVAWRKVVGARFRGRVNVSDADIDRELADTQPSAAGLRVLYSEIILPAPDRPTRDQAYRLAAQLGQIRSPDAFSAAARTHSAAPSAENGGRVDWVNAADMQPGLLQILLAMGPGQVSDPLPIPGGVALLQLRSVADGLPPPAQGREVDYAVYLIPGGRSPAALAEAARVQEQVGTCDELYALNRRQKGPDERLERVKGPMASVPTDIALELGRMDPGEFTTGVTRGDFLALIMLCSRQVPLPEGVSRDQVRDQLLNRQLQTLAAGYLAELRDAAVIRRP